MYDIFIGIDVGNNGGISILNGKEVSVYPMPTITEKKAGKTKTRYDLIAIKNILLPFVGKKVLFGLERVSPMPGEGSVSSYAFGVGSGILQGMAVALGFDLRLVSPAVWKKGHPQLETPHIASLRVEMKELKKNGNDKKKVSKLRISIKTEAKDAARNLVASLYPALAEEFKFKYQDGKAESLLIALFCQRSLNELVQESTVDSEP